MQNYFTTNDYNQNNVCNNRWAKVRWAKVRWANVRWAKVRWANVRWAKVRAPYKIPHNNSVTLIDENSKSKPSERYPFLEYGINHKMVRVENT